MAGFALKPALQLWWKAVRPYAYSASLVPVAIGGFYARFHGGDWSPVRFGVALLAGLLVHTAANLWNDYYDFKSGVDHAGGGVGSGVLVAGEMAPAVCFRGAVVCAALSGLLGIWLITQVGWALLWLGLFGIAGAWAYSAGPFSPKHRALGEVWVFLLMGAGMTLGGYLAQTGCFAWRAVGVGVPAALLMTLILYVNNLRDIRSDRAAGLHTLPMLLKPLTAKLVVALVLLGAYGLASAMAIGRHVPLATLAVWLAGPLAWRLFRQTWRGPVREQEVVGAAMLHMAFGLLFAVGLWFR